MEEKKYPLQKAYFKYNLCPTRALYKVDGEVRINNEKCNLCMKCVEVCHYLLIYTIYSNSIVAGGFGVRSYTTLVTSGISLVILDSSFFKTSHGSSMACAVMPSLDSTALTDII
ncbi:MAG TPA: hypothetical protein EYP22_08270 [Methanosarcinales archaeon]|nr:hypothetical protein [Methanosarcinales archaeon]